MPQTVATLPNTYIARDGASASMSLELDWSLLDDELAVRFLDSINRALSASASKRPSFLGDIHFDGLRFGSDPPDVAIQSISDIWQDFVSIDEAPVRRRGASRHATPRIQLDHAGRVAARSVALARGHSDPHIYPIRRRRTSAPHPRPAKHCVGQCGWVGTHHAWSRIRGVCIPSAVVRCTGVERNSPAAGLGRCVVAAADAGDKPGRLGSAFSGLLSALAADHGRARTASAAAVFGHQFETDEL